MRSLKFGSAVMFFSIHYLFDRMESLRNFFINCSKTLGMGGYLVVTTFDGCLVLDKLLENKGTYSQEGEWSIKLESDIKSLSSSIKNGFGKKINVFVDSIGTQNVEYLVNPTLLITFAKMMGFSLEEIETKSTLEHPTNTFDNILDYVDIDDIPVKKWFCTTIVLQNSNSHTDIKKDVDPSNKTSHIQK